MSIEWFLSNNERQAVIGCIIFKLTFLNVPPLFVNVTSKSFVVSLVIASSPVIFDANNPYLKLFN